MERRKFDSVWYLPEENRWHDGNLLAYRDVGRLTLTGRHVEFEGRAGRVVVEPIRSVSIGKQGRDFVNEWIKIEYGPATAPAAAYFADGSWLGWGGVFGGTKRILSAVLECLG